MVVGLGLGHYYLGFIGIRRQSYIFQSGRTEKRRDPFGGWRIQRTEAEVEAAAGATVKFREGLE